MIDLHSLCPVYFFPCPTNFTLVRCPHDGPTDLKADVEMEVGYLIHLVCWSDLLGLPMLPPRSTSIRYLRMRDELHVADVSPGRLAR
jgi:hypothetical protein